MNPAILALLFCINLGLAQWYYARHGDGLILHHKYSLTMDLIAWTGGIGLCLVAMRYYRPSADWGWALYGQASIGMAIFSIHAVRCIHRLKVCGSQEKNHAHRH